MKNEEQENINEEVKNEGPKYDKANDFFDCISNSTMQKGNSERPNRAELDDMRKRDFETFGYSSSNRGRGGRGGYRGGRGGYRGGRGGY